VAHNNRTQRKMIIVQFTYTTQDTLVEPMHGETLCKWIVQQTHPEHKIYYTNTLHDLINKVIDGKYENQAKQ
jgi:hypothetical protein